MKCAYIKADGNQCQANAMKNYKYCFAHNPKTKEEHALAVVKGGKASKRDRLNLEPIDIQKPDDVIGLLEETINGIREGNIPPKIANTIGYLCGHLLKAIEAADLDQRLEIIERVIFERKQIKKEQR